MERVYLREESGAFIRPSFPAPNIPLAAISTYKVYLNIGTMQCVSPGGGAGGGGGTSGFQVTGMIEEFFGVGKFNKYFLGVFKTI